MTAHHDDHSELGHVLPYSTYLSVFIALVVLTVITVAAAQMDFGNMNLVVAMVIASIKAGIVALFFMHLKYENPITWLYCGFPIFLLALMIGLIFLDNPFRELPEHGTFIEKRLIAAEAAQKKEAAGGSEH